MSETPQFLVERLLQEGERSCTFFQELPPEDWDQVIYSEGAQWTVHQVLAHFVAAETSLYRLVQNVAAGGGGSPEDFNLDAYNERKVAELAPIPNMELVERFRQHRQLTAALVGSLEPADLEKQGRHPFMGLTTLNEMIKLIYRHNQIHQREIRQGLKRSGFSGT